MTFHNTIPLTGSELVTAQRKTETQAQKIATFFRDNPGNWTPFEVHSKLQLLCPITSVRRAITDLTNAGYLKKTPYQKKEQYGMLNNTWTIADRQYKLL